MYFTLYYISTITVCRMVYYPLVCGRLMPLEEEEVPLDEYLHNIAHCDNAEEKLARPKYQVIKGYPAWRGTLL